MIIGEYKTKLGNKNRISVPKKFREEIGKNLIITRGYEHSLVLVNKKMWEKLADEILNGSFINRNIRETSRFLVGSANEVETDKLGRILIPKHLVKHAGLKKNTIFVGLGNWIEIWSEKNWKEKLNYLDENGEKLADEINKLSDNQDVKH